MNWLQQWAGYMPQMLSGLGVSLFIAGVSIVIGYPLGLLLSVMVQRKNLVIRTLGLAIVEIGRGAPALVILYLVYYGLPKFGIAFESIQAACIALVWNAAAYSSEIIRAGLQSVARGQTEAAQVLGLSSRDTFFRVIMPQGMRSAIPGLMGVAIQMFQGTSLAYAIAVPELMKSAYNIGSQDFNYLQIFTLAGICYAAISMPATWITVYFEKRMSRHA
ncbi:MULTISPECIES: amino acid ABC transporter permease [Arthrobacter]|jgi:polar amino acid transport system permease protein|uniref:Amino acid ABC transporter membrane protein 2, PAAT family n=1 Tax=Arthrobacter woluwensis TaxID=156980 RepID=A0A1H4JPQ5_9MICC|nr:MULTISPECIES: amino acid ABC transporter permease [Arthrobacter]PSS43204.1 amino acid ABC transporter permease [Arthrobacter woluwensis]QTF73124.1 amino acid ABC transporter permease [Arthrobacter woluwensis]SEB47592.1 amino acid ABC transporter membrane protein 2, PAAT family [Arthrobacter woluwensis]